MAALELLTDVAIDRALDEWAAVTARAWMLTAIHCGSGMVNPELYNHRDSQEKLTAIRRAFVAVERKLQAYGDHLPGRYWTEHNMLLPGELPNDLPTQELRAAAQQIVAHLGEVIAERNG